MTKKDVQEIILATKVIAVIRLADAAKLHEVAEALRLGGVKALEVTMTTAGALEAIRQLARTKAADGLIGAGTVLDAKTASAAVKAGAEFVVSPITDLDTIRMCRKLDTFVAPGAMTPTEIMSAWTHGADVVKVFPATSLGPQFFRDVKAPFPAVRLMPTGGVSIENARQFIEAGACAVGVGTALIDKKAIEAGDWGILTEKARRLVESLRGI